MSTGRGTILIVGGGASGTILAAHLLQSTEPSSLRVVIVERRDAVGPGLAYSTPHPEHLLNVNARNMGAFARDPEHFRRWLDARGITVEGQSSVYAPRSVFGDYLRDLMAQLERKEQGSGRLRIVHGDAESAIPTAGGVELRLRNGASLVGRVAVLATGHEQESPSGHAFAIRIGSPADTPLDPDATVLILGTGLSMVDAWLVLRHRGHRGEIVALSRRGLIPSPHRANSPMRLDSADIPLGTDLSYFVRWFRRLVRETQREGGDWRDVVDGLRPFNQRIWQNWPASARRRFLGHTKAWWDIHRHRMAPEIHARVAEAVRTGGLRPLAGRLSAVDALADGSFDVTIIPRHRGTAVKLNVARLYDCAGMIRDVSTCSAGVVGSLIRDGYARPDPLHIGLDVTPDCSVIDRNGKPHDNLFAIGPLTRGTFFEIEAIPDIRVQCAALALRLTGG